MDQDHLRFHKRRPQSFLVVLGFIPVHSRGTERASSQARKPFYNGALTLVSPPWASPSVESWETSAVLLLRFGPS